VTCLEAHWPEAGTYFGISVGTEHDTGHRIPERGDRLYGHRVVLPSTRTAPQPPQPESTAESFHLLQARPDLTPSLPELELQEQPEVVRSRLVAVS
jgi:hypothetical protein